MKAMILAAGRGERMRPLTDQTPKPLLQVGGQPLIQWHLQKMAACGIREVCINLAHLGHQIEASLGKDAGLGLQIRYSHEPDGALETAGGIATAQPWHSARDEQEPGAAGNNPNDWFLVVNGDVYTDWPFESALRLAEALRESTAQACLVLAPNPDHHPQGDFLRPCDRADDQPEALLSPASAEGATQLQAFTYAGLGLYRPSLFGRTAAHQRAPLAPLLAQAAAQGQLLGLVHRGAWTDVGTPKRLSQLDQSLRPSATSQA